MREHDETQHALSDRTAAIYDAVASAYDAERRKDLFELPWLRRALRDVRPGGAVLDLGCGAGEPIGAWLVGQGYAVTGADFAPAMLDLFRARLPQARVAHADMRALDLGARFDAIIGWGSFFHLTPDEQRKALPRIAAHLAPGGRLLLTVGPGADEGTGTAGGRRVYHASLGPNEYRAILDTAQSPVEAFAPEAWDAAGHSMLLARRLMPDSVDN